MTLSGVQYRARGTACGVRTEARCLAGIPFGSAESTARAIDSPVLPHSAQIAWKILTMLTHNSSTVCMGACDDPLS